MERAGPSIKSIWNIEPRVWSSSHRNRFHLDDFACFAVVVDFSISERVSATNRTYCLVGFVARKPFATQVIHSTQHTRSSVEHLSYVCRCISVPVFHLNSTRVERISSVVCVKSKSKFVSVHYISPPIESENCVSR